MRFSKLPMDPELIELLRKGAMMFLLLVASVTVHEWAHAFVANKLGDPEPRLNGRLSLNPMVHLDTFGTLVLPLLLVLVPVLFPSQGLSIFGWGKPMPLSLPNSKTRRRDDILIHLAGPVANLGIALIAACLGGFLASAVPGIDDFFAHLISLNVSLCLFNLLPIPPLDGARLMRSFFKMKEETYLEWSRYGFLVVLLLLSFTPLGWVMQLIIHSLDVGFQSIMSLVSL